MSKHLVKLTPVGKYFFGGEMTFGAKVLDEKFVSYIIRSSKTPQQTTLLGMLRFLLLSGSGCFDKKSGSICDKAGADALIGRGSFDVDEVQHKANDFGMIKSIGPCCLCEKETGLLYVKESRDRQLDVDFSEASEAQINGRKRLIPHIKTGTATWTAKESVVPMYIAASGRAVEESYLFTEDARIGIDKDYKGATKDKSLFKQVSYRLRDGFCFAFVAEADCDLAEHNGELVQLGADSSIFSFEAEKIDGDVSYPQLTRYAGSVVLLSDAYLGAGQIEEPVFAMTTIRPFRFLHTQNSVDSKQYNINYYVKRSQKRYDLYEAGSVFYFEDEEDMNAFVDRIESYREFRQIGYNQYTKKQLN